ncbi:hypothetical protein [Atlanticothrix silvestris]|uniref:hypothetical protein n=1 Tax=Atlanticothrix silvestris TaxID=2840444 RepID=UPI00298EE7E6|nr:hypothetical protein [Atlanticothrix silvestris]
MKRILKTTKFITIVIFLIFTVVASNGIEYHKLATNAQAANGCLFPDSLSCIDYSKQPRSLIVPNPKLSDNERFLSAIASKLKSIPQLGTYEYTFLHVYGAAFVNPQTEIKLPSTVIFANEQETNEFQTTLTMQKVDDTNDCYLQKSAAVALNKARSLQNIPLKSGYGTGDCTRSFATNLKFWQKYTNNQTLEKVK